MEPLAFLYVVKHVLKVIEDVWSIDLEHPCFFIRSATRVKSMMVRDGNHELMSDLYALVH
jgi:hypothetical protein